jgi:hypothetical protein
MQAQLIWLRKKHLSGQDSNKMLEWVQNQLEGRQIDLRNFLRWEDDGGKIVEVNMPTIGLLSN